MKFMLVDTKYVVVSCSNDETYFTGLHMTNKYNHSKLFPVVSC